MKFFLNVGAEKAGTTWLYQYLAFHPEFHDIGKELNVIQRDDLVPTLYGRPSFQKDINSYFSYIADLDLVTGDFTHYEGSTENVYRIIKDGFAKHNIDVVPCYIMRDPIKRAWSAWNMIGGGTDLQLPPAALFVMRNFLDCKYKETVQALDNVFDTCLYFFYENFFDQQSADTICDALHISREPAFDTPINKGNYDPNVPQQFVELFGKTTKNRQAVEFINERFGNAPWRIEDYT